MMLKEEAKVCRWIVINKKTNFALTINLPFTFKGCTFVVFDKEYRTKRVGFQSKAEERSIWEFNLEKRNWTEISIPENLKLSDIVRLTSIQIPRHVLY